VGTDYLVDHYVYWLRTYRNFIDPKHKHNRGSTSTFNPLTHPKTISIYYCQTDLRKLSDAIYSQ